MSWAEEGPFQRVVAAAQGSGKRIVSWIVLAGLVGAASGIWGDRLLVERRESTMEERINNLRDEVKEQGGKISVMRPAAELVSKDEFSQYVAQTNLRLARIESLVDKTRDLSEETNRILRSMRKGP